MAALLLLLLQDPHLRNAIKKLSECEISYRVETAYHKVEAKGWMTKTGCALKGTGQIVHRMPHMKNFYGDKNELEFYAEQDRYLVTIRNDKFKQGFVEPSQIPGEDGVVTATLRNPWVMLGELEWGMAEAKAVEDAVEGPIKNPDQKVEILRRMMQNHGEGRKYANAGAIKAVLDVQATAVTYKAWVKDGALAKIEKKIKIELKTEIRHLLDTVGKAGGMDVPVLDYFSGLWTIEFKGKAESWDIPKEVKSKLGWK